MPMVAGMDAMAWAKMMGITPDMFTLMGMWLDWPPYIFRPTTRLAYCTGMRRSALVINTMKMTSRSMPTMISGMNAGCRVSALSPLVPLAQLVTPLIIEDTIPGPRATMPANRMMEMPLPTPNSVICSPSHITKAEPAVKAAMITMAGHTPSAEITPAERING